MKAPRRRLSINKVSNTEIVLQIMGSVDKSIKRIASLKDLQKWKGQYLIKIIVIIIIIK